MINPIRRYAMAIMLALVALGATQASAQTERKAGHVIIIGVDGLSPDGISKAKTPIMDDMMEKGSWTMNARGVLPTTSSANWASILTGVGPEQHGVTSNDWRVGEFNIPTSVTGSGNFFPSIFQLLRDRQPGWKIGSIYNWAGFADLYDRRFVDHDAHGETEEATTQLAVDYILRDKPDFLFIHLDNIDHIGHSVGHGTPAYYEAVEQVDARIGRIRQATIDAGIARDTVIIVTSDHGGVGKGHGGETLAEIEVPWIIYGKGIRSGNKLDLPINTFDTPATSAWLLGVEVPYAWIGRPVKAILHSEAKPDQAYRTSSFYAAPVIEPEASGNDPAGGLFVGRPAQMTIRNPNTVGEVHYTLDGSLPTIASAIYAGPVRISNSTIARATLFVEGKAASVPATGYFRVLDRDKAATAGVRYSVYLLPEEPARLPDFSRLTPVASGETHEFSIDDLPLPRDNNVAAVFEGFIRIATPGTYRFSLASDDGSKLYIGGKAVVDNDGQHGVLPASGSVELKPGTHPIRVEYFNAGGGSWLGAYIEGPAIPRQLIDPNLLSKI
ncbi:MAG: phosphodiesterase [Alphaproteobacteria bacterium HGW-Alphaproteobacteria-16]|nr:MAG: phosphodiesterase [Alphaproteobacteria bacterium HGW-Alphaproteobacteria-16]